MTSEKFYRLLYERKNGAGVVEQLSGPAAAKKLKTLRRPARLMDGENQVGGIVEADGSQDDQRIRWNYWYDMDILGKEKS